MVVGTGASLTISGSGTINATTGDTATAFFPTGTLEHERGGLEADVSAFGAGLYGQTAGFATINIDTEAELETAAVAGANIIVSTELDTFAELDALVADKALVNKADGAIWSGVHDFGGATSLETVNAAAPTVDAAGEFAVDTTNDQWVYFGTAKRVLDARKQIDFTLESPADADNFLVWKPQYNVTITNIECIVDPGDSAESVVITMEEVEHDMEIEVEVEGIMVDEEEVKEDVHDQFS